MILLNQVNGIQLGLVLIIVWLQGLTYGFPRVTTWKRTERTSLWITPESIEGTIMEDLVKGLDVVRMAYIPENTDSAFAIGISEAVAGGIGGLISRGVANVVGDKKVDSVETKVTSTSAYFGVRSVTRGFARLVGLPAPIALVLASLTGSIALETTKASFRSRSEDKKPQNSKTRDDEGLAKTMMSVISVREIVGDVTKWIVFDLFVQAMPIAAIGVEKNLLYFALGSAAALTGNFVKLVLPSNRVSVWDQAVGGLLKPDKSVLVSFSQAALEGGVLFMTYSFALYEAQELIPNQFNMNFFFNSLLTGAEQSIEQAIIDNKL